MKAETYTPLSCPVGPDATSFTELKHRMQNFAGGGCSPLVSQEKGGKSSESFSNNHREIQPLSHLFPERNLRFG